MCEQGKEVCHCLSAVCPIPYPTLNPVHVINDAAAVVEDHYCSNDPQSFSANHC